MIFIKTQIRIEYFNRALNDKRTTENTQFVNTFDETIKLILLHDFIKRNVI